MTDKEKLVQLLQEFGVGCREKPEGIKVGGYNKYKKVSGYSGFYTLFEFDKVGNFVRMGAWE